MSSSCRSRACTAWPWLAALLLYCLMPGSAAATTDIRVLVPMEALAENRDGASPGRDAIALLIDLLPGDSRAGIWAYDDSVATLAPHGAPDARWRKDAALALRELSIPSSRTRTNLENALAATASKWRESGHERHLILIMSPEPPSSDLRAAVQRSRARILTEAIPALRAARVRIHVIVHGSGEIPLAGRLAAASGGLLLHAADGEALTERVLELAQLLRPLSLPIRHRELIIDEGVTRLTLALLGAPEVPGSELRAPDGRRYRADAAIGDIRWRQAANHETVIIEKPAPGVWRIDPAGADIRAWFDGAPLLRPSRLPLRALAGDHVALLAALNENAGKALLTVSHQEPDGSSRILARAMATKEEPLRIELPRGLAAGTHRLSIEAAGDGFQRSWHQRLEALDSPLHLEFSRSNGKPLLSLIPWADVLRHEDLHIGATLTDGRRFVARLQAERGTPQEWLIDLAAHESPRLLQLTLETAGTRTRGGVLLHQDRPRGFDTMGLHPPEPLPVRTSPPSSGSNEYSVSDTGPASGLAIAGSIMMLVSTLGGAALLMQALRAAPQEPPARAPGREEPRATATIGPKESRAIPAPVTEPLPQAAPDPKPAGEIFYNDDTVLPDMGEATVMETEMAPDPLEPSPASPGDGTGPNPLDDIDITEIELDFSEEAVNPT